MRFLLIILLFYAPTIASAGHFYLEPYFGYVYNADASNTGYGAKIGYEKRKWAYGAEYMEVPVSTSVNSNHIGVFVHRYFRRVKFGVSYFISNSVNGADIKETAYKIDLGYEKYRHLSFNFGYFSFGPKTMYMFAIGFPFGDPDRDR
ncbi:MAG: hypothetical protein V4736_14575 [Bdellovibrionota bacterium]